MEGLIRIAYVNDASDQIGLESVKKVVTEQALGTVDHLTIQQVLDGALDNGGYNVVFHARHLFGPSAGNQVGEDGSNFTIVPAGLREAIDRALAAGVGFITEWQGGSPVWTALGPEFKYNQMTEANLELWKWYQGTVDRGDAGWFNPTFANTGGDHPVMQGLDASFSISAVEFCYRVQSPDASLGVLATFTDNGGTVRPAILAGTRGRGRVVLWPCDWGDNGGNDANVRKWIENSIRWAAVPAETDGESTETIDENGGTVTVTEDGEEVAAVNIPPGTFDDDVEVTVRIKEVSEDAQCHDYLIGQIGRCIEVTAKKDGQDAVLHQNLRVAVCLPEELHLEIYKFEEKDGPAVPQRQVDVSDFIDCSQSSQQTSSRAPRNWFEGLAMGLSNRVGKWISPRMAYAADRGFGCEVEKDAGLSTFTWASPIQVTDAGLAINFFNSGKDAFGVSGVFGLEAKNFEPFEGEAGFDPNAHAVTVLWGEFSETIPPGPSSWRFVKRTGRWTFTSPAPFGNINYMDIDPITGDFRVAGRTPTEGDVLPTFREFTVQLAHRLRGAGLHCQANGTCHPEPGH